MADETIETKPMTRTEGGLFAPGNPGGPGRPARKQEDAYRAAVLKSLTPEKFSKILEKATDDALDSKSWKCRKEGRDFLLRCLIQTGVLSDYTRAPASPLPKPEELEPTVMRMLELSFSRRANADEPQPQTIDVEEAHDD